MVLPLAVGCAHAQALATPHPARGVGRPRLPRRDPRDSGRAGPGSVRCGSSTVRRGTAERPVFSDRERAVPASAENAGGSRRRVRERGPTRARGASPPNRRCASRPAFSTSRLDVAGASVNAAPVDTGQASAVMLVAPGPRRALAFAAVAPVVVAFALIGMGPFGIGLQQVLIAAVIISLGFPVHHGLVVDRVRRVRRGATQGQARGGTTMRGAAADRLRRDVGEPSRRSGVATGQRRRAALPAPSQPCRRRARSPRRLRSRPCSPLGFRPSPRAVRSADGHARHVGQGLRPRLRTRRVRGS